MKLSTIVTIASTAAALPTSESIYNESPVSTVYQFPNETWVENLAIRSNGKILVTLLTSPEVWQIDPTQRSAELIYHFPNATSALGIAEVHPEVFAVAVGNISVATIESVPGSYSIWQLDFEKRKHHAQVKKITDLPQAAFLNGMCVLPGRPGSVLIADSAQGLIYELDTKTRSSRVWLDDPAFKPNSTLTTKSGINGIHVHEGYLYFSNGLATPVFGRVPITQYGEPAGPVEIIVDQPPYATNIDDHADDFAFDRNGNAWLATDPSNSIVKITPYGKVSVEVGGVHDATVAGVTAVQFGRTKMDRNILYASTNGGFASPPPGGIVGGKVLAVDTSELCSKKETQ